MACERASERAPPSSVFPARSASVQPTPRAWLCCCFCVSWLIIFFVFCPYFPGIILICGDFSVILPRPRSGGGSVISAPGLPNPLAGAWITNHPALFFHFAPVYRFLLPFSFRFLLIFSRHLRPRPTRPKILCVSSVRRQRFRALCARRRVYGFLIAAAELACSASG